jgi:hypothetical protein
LKDEEEVNDYKRDNMSILARMLPNFYIKAGAPERESELIGSLFGDQYFEYKKKHRIGGREIKQRH